MNLLFIDCVTDRLMFFIERFGYHNVDMIESSKGAIDKLKNKKYDIIFLGGELNSGDYGSNVAEWLSKNNDNVNFNALIFIHTWNPIEVDLSMELLPQAKFLPFDVEVYSTFDI